MLICALLLVAVPVSAADDPWFAFQQGDLIGFKNARGKVMMAPKLCEGPTVARRFDNIIAAGECAGEQFDTFYLLKDGRRVGAGSLYMFDATPDCESEGSIRFHDRQSDKIGYFDRNGEVMIAAQFNVAGPFRNGVAWVQRGAVKQCSGHGPEDCEHYAFKGGEKLLIDRTGRTLVEGFDTDNLHTLDWHSLTVSEQPPDDARRVSFKGVNGRYYSFIDVEKEFSAWFAKSFLPHLDTASLLANSFHTVWHGESDQPLNSYGRMQGKSAVTKYVPALRRHLKALRASEEYGVRVASSPWPFEAERDPQYFDNCGNFTQWKTPLVSAMEHWNRGSFSPDKHASFDFIRTKDGYRLLSFSLPGRE